MKKFNASLYFGGMVTFILFAVNSPSPIMAAIISIFAGIMAGFFMNELLGLIQVSAGKAPGSTAETDSKP